MDAIRTTNGDPLPHTSQPPFEYGICFHGVTNRQSRRRTWSRRARGQSLVRARPVSPKEYAQGAMYGKGMYGMYGMYDKYGHYTQWHDIVQDGEGSGRDRVRRDRRFPIPVRSGRTVTDSYDKFDSPRILHVHQLSGPIGGYTSSSTGVGPRTSVDVVSAGRVLLTAVP